MSKRIDARATPPSQRAARAAQAANPTDGVTEAGTVLWEALVTAVAERVASAGPVPVQPEWLDVEGAADYLCCSKHRVYRLVSMRRIPFHKEGARTLFSRAELNEWVRTGGAG